MDLKENKIRDRDMSYNLLQQHMDQSVSDLKKSDRTERIWVDLEKPEET